MVIEPVQLNNTRRFILQEMKGMLEIGDVETKVAVIKAVGNAGIVDFFPDVERILKDKSQPIIVREQAIYAMRRIAAVMPKAVRSSLYTRERTRRTGFLF